MACLDLMALPWTRDNDLISVCLWDQLIVDSVLAIVAVFVIGIVSEFGRGAWIGTGTDCGTGVQWRLPSNEISANMGQDWIVLIFGLSRKLFGFSFLQLLLQYSYGLIWPATKLFLLLWIVLFHSRFSFTVRLGFSWPWCALSFKVSDGAYEDGLSGLEENA